MGLFLRQDDNRSELQSKVAADLQQKLRQTSALEGKLSQPDPKFLEDQHQTRPAGVLIGLMLAVLIGFVIYLLTIVQY